MFYPDTQGCCGSLHTVYIQKPSVLWRSSLLLQIKQRRLDSCVVAVMACHLPAWPPVGTTGASLMASSSTVAAWFLAIAHFGATVAGQSVMGLRPCSTSQCWLSIPMGKLNLQLRRIVIPKWQQQRPRICSVRLLCVASVALALVFMPGLYSTAYRATFPAFLCGCLWFVSTVCVILFVFSFLFCLLRRCPFLATFLSVLLCRLSLLISERIFGLIWFVSVYLVTTAGFVADQLM